MKQFHIEVTTPANYGHATYRLGTCNFATDCDDKSAPSPSYLLSPPPAPRKCSLYPAPSPLFHNSAPSPLLPAPAPTIKWSSMDPVH